MANTPYMIGLDLGTSGVKAIGLTQSGKLISIDRVGTAELSHAGHLTQPAELHWRLACNATRTLVVRLGDAADVAGICLSGAMHSLLAIDRQGDAIGPAETWAASSGIDSAHILNQTDSAWDSLYQRTGCPVVGLYHPTRIRAKHQANEIPSSLSKWVSIKEFIVAKMTGKWCCDLSIASATGLMNLHNHFWDEQALSLAGVDVGQLSELVRPTTVVGGLTPTAAEAMGLTEGLPVIAGGSDGAMANIGAGEILDAKPVVTIGTSAAVRMLCQKPRLSNNKIWCYSVDEENWLAGGAMNNGGSILDRLATEWYGHDVDYDRMMRDAAEAGPGADGLVVLPWYDGERGTPFPMRGQYLANQNGEISVRRRIRATMEGLAYCIKVMHEKIQDDQTCNSSRSHPKHSQNTIRLTGGVSKIQLWRQILADVTDLSVAPIAIADASAIGAAMIGWIGLAHQGDWSSLQNLVPSTPDSGLVHPEPRHRDIYQKGREQFDLLCASLGFNSHSRIHSGGHWND